MALQLNLTPKQLLEQDQNSVMHQLKESLLGFQSSFQVEKLEVLDMGMLNNEMHLPFHTKESHH